MAHARLISLEEVALHNSRASCWIVLHGKVYDVTNFLNDHPGGSEIMEAHFGRDASAAFDEVNHSDEAHEMLKDWLQGIVRPSNSKL